MWMNLNPAMLAWIPRIKQAGFRLGILSNMGDGVLDYMRPRFPWLAQFDHLTWSCELGVVKPDPAIYLHTVKKLNVSPDRALFIDNLQKNIVGAEAVGLHAALFENPEQLQSDWPARFPPYPASKQPVEPLPHPKPGYSGPDAGLYPCQGQTDLLHDLQVETLQCGHVGGCVGEQADLADVQIGKDLAADAHLAQNPLVPIRPRCSPLRCKKRRWGSQLRSISKPLLVLCR